MSAPSLRAASRPVARPSPRRARCPRAGLRVVANADAFAEVGSGSTREGALAAEKYIASNRFFVKPGKGPKFEARWATRKSRLALLDGFEFFTLMRRVDEGAPDSEPNYVSFTVWSDQESFTAWRTGEAFKEAHGGGSLWGFVQMLVSSSQTLVGAPKPAFYEGLLPVCPPVEDAPASVGGWREVAADGVSPLNAECLVAQNRFKIAPGAEGAFEERWASRESKLTSCDGFVAFHLMRRDAPEADDGYNFVSTTVWRDMEAFEAWREANVTAGHGQGKEGAKAPPSGQMMLGPPSVALYEGVLMLYPDKEGAAALKEAQAVEA